MNVKKEHRFKNIIFAIFLVVFFCQFGESSNAQTGSRYLYRVPLTEIAEKIEYQYIYDNMIYDLSSKGNFFELDLLPTGENISVAVYTIEGNKILFLPEEMMNTKIYLNGVSTGMHCSDEGEGYLFYILYDQGADEATNPVISLEDGYSGRITETIVMKENINEVVFQGEIEMTFDPEKRMDLPPVDVEENEYIDAMLFAIKNTLRDKQEYGTYNIHIETYGRVHRKNGVSTAKITGVVVGKAMEQYFQFDIYDMEGMIEEARTTDGHSPDETDLYFVSENTMEDKPSDFISGVIGLGREVIPLEVTAETENMTDVTISAKKGVNHRKLDFSKMSADEAVTWIGDVCAYSEYFGLNELGGRSGEASDWGQKEVIMYTWEDSSDSLLFVPKEAVNTMVVGKNDEKYPLHMDKDGNVRFYCIMNNPYGDISGQLPVILPFREIVPGDNVKQLIKMGEAKLNIPEQPKQSVTKIDAKEEYINSLAEHVKEILEKDGIIGKYKMYVGELGGIGSKLEPSPNVCISAAVIGEKEYYFRYMIVKSQTDQYYFWPIGFGLNGSLEECEGEKHYMNRLCIERTKQLNRCEIDIDI